LHRGQARSGPGGSGDGWRTVTGSVAVPRRVLIAGAGVAGLETLLALRALAADRVDVTILAPELKFRNRSITVDQPFKARRVRGHRLEDIATELNVGWRRGALDRVEGSPRRVVTKAGDEVPYDVLVLSGAVRRLLREGGVALHESSYAVPSRRGWLEISPGERGLAVDRIVTVPRLVGPRLRGIPCVRDGFIHTDAHGRVPGRDGVFAAGDATNCPIKHGGLAAQQADAVAEAIADSVGVDVDPQPFRPILHGLLRTGRSSRFLRADVSGCAGDDSVIAERALWWPPNKLYARYLAPYLSSQVGSAAHVVPPDEHAIPAEPAVATGPQRPRGLPDSPIHGSRA
jgi:hypothetical protein